jgi:dihydroxyacetone kinase-like predicted kinase
MKNQHSELIGEKEEKAEEAPAPTVAAPVEEYGFVAVTMGDGMRSVFTDLGVGSFVSGGQTMNPSTEQLVEAILQTPAKTVYLFPNNANICMVAEQAAKIVEDRTVISIPTVSVPQGIAALMQFDPDASHEDNRQAMLDALKSVKTLDLTYAAHDSMVDGQSVSCGQILGLVEHKVRYIADQRVECLEKMLPEMEGASFVTVFYGSDVTDTEASETLAFLQSKLPDTEIALLSGGQPLYYYVISVE